MCVNKTNFSLEVAGDCSFEVFQGLIELVMFFFAIG